MTTAHSPVITRQGTITRKASKLDRECQTWLVRQWSDGSIEQYLTHEATCRWVTFQGNAEDIDWGEDNNHAA